MLTNVQDLPCWLLAYYLLSFRSWRMGTAAALFAIRAAASSARIENRKVAAPQEKEQGSSRRSSFVTVEQLPTDEEHGSG
jgi:hypothetical protein